MARLTFVSSRRRWCEAWPLPLLFLTTLITGTVIASPAVGAPTPAIQALLDEVGTMPPFQPDPNAQAEFFDFIASRGGPKGGGCNWPDCVVWTDFDGVDFTTPSRAQGCCGACTAFGILSAMEIGLKWRYRDVFVDPNFDLDLSEWQLALTYTSGGADEIC